MIKVLEILPTLGYGGIATMVTNYFYSMDHGKYAIDFVTHGAHEDYHDEITKHGSSIFYLKTIKRMGFFKYFKELKKIISSGSYNVVHFHSCGVRLLILPYLKKRKIRIVIHSHSNKKGRFPNFLWKRMSWKYGDALLACSTKAGQVAFGKRKFDIIPNAINIKK